MLPLRFPRIWWFLGWLMVVAVFVGSLMPGRYVAAAAAHDKLLHAGAYFVLTVWFCGLYRRERHIAVAVLALAMGVLLDSLQGLLPYRRFDFMDIAANGGGILLGWIVSRSLLEAWCLRVERLFAA